MVRRKRKRCIYFGFKGDALLEYWLQRYLRENASKYGMKIIKCLSGRGGGGGDFLVQYQGERMKVEVEWIYSFYDHANDPKYNDVKILACLDILKPGDEKELKKYGCPPIVVWLSTEDFSRWYKEKTGRECLPYAYFGESKPISRIRYPPPPYLYLNWRVYFPKLLKKRI